MVHYRERRYPLFRARTGELIRMNTTPKVIDLYHADAVSSFEDAYKAGIRGVIHKATEGATLTDKLYAQRREMALDAGMLWGAYHFLRPGDMAGQARRFVDEAQPTEGTLLAVDHEDPRVKLGDLLKFIEEASGESDRPLVLYSGFLIKEQLSRPTPALPSLRLWLAQYSAAPKWPSAWSSPWLWQYTDSGQIEGITNKVDLNSFEGTDDELAAQWGA